MSPPLLLPPFSFIIKTFIFLPLFFLIPTYTTSDVESYTYCAPFSCGNLTNISYPFWNINNQPSYCGHPNFTLHCQHNNLTIEINSQKFHIIDINQTSQILKIAKLDLWSYDATTTYSCPKQYNINLDSNFFKYTSNDKNYTLLYECDPLPNPYSSPLSPKVFQKISCLIDGKPQDAYLVSSDKLIDFIAMNCKNSIIVPSLKSSLNEDSNILEEGFEIGWSDMEEDICDGCVKSSGRCGYNVSQNEVMCLCPNSQYFDDCGICNMKSKTKIWMDNYDCKRSRLYKSMAPSPLGEPIHGKTPSNGFTPSHAIVPSYVPNSKDSSDSSSMYSFFILCFSRV